MFFRTLLFFVLIYFLIKVVSRLFLSNQTNQKRGGNGFFYQNRTSSKGGRQKNSPNRHFEEIEEAEFEDITEEEKTESKRSD